MFIDIRNLIIKGLIYLFLFLFVSFASLFYTTFYSCKRTENKCFFLYHGTLVPVDSVRTDLEMK